MIRQRQPLPRLAGLLAGALLLGAPVLGQADTGDLPWGAANVMERDYSPRQVVYDVYVDSEREMDAVLDRVSMLNNIYEADPFESHIVMVLHGSEIPFFSREQFAEREKLMRRAKSLTDAGNIEFRMCRAAARAHGVDTADVHGFVNIVPMADAEIIDLQHEGYVYMQ
ncbi:MAG: DsrE family protein [Pseudomonadota bacterium]